MKSATYKRMWQKDGVGHYVNVEVQVYSPEPGSEPEMVLGSWCTDETKQAALEGMREAWEDWDSPGVSLKAIEHDYSLVDTVAADIKMSVRDAAGRALLEFGMGLPDGTFEQPR